MAKLCLDGSTGIRGRYDDYGSGQEYQVSAGESYLEDFGGRVEGPAYKTELSFEQWVIQKIEQVSASGHSEPGYRPDQNVFLNLMPADFMGQPIHKKGTGTSSSTGFFPTALGYVFPEPEHPSNLINAASRLYLKDPVVETLGQASLVTGFTFKVDYERRFFRAMDDQMDLFVSLFYRRQCGIVVVGLCAYSDRVAAQEGMLGCQKLFLQGLAWETK